MAAIEEGTTSVLAHLRKTEKSALGTVTSIALICVGLDWCDFEPYEQIKGWLIAAAGIVVLYALVPALVRCGMAGGAKSVWSVVRVSLMLLLFTLISFYSSYYLISASFVAPGRELSDKYLNFPPVIAALWTAGMGWYIHFQATSKNHRTNNSFNLLMQTRTSAEFLRRALDVQMVFPFGCNVTKDDEGHFSSDNLKVLAQQTLSSLSVEEGGAGQPPTLDESKVKAIEGMKYLLNYYEFMAVGIEANDLEENMLFNTIGGTVCSIRDRADLYVQHVRKNGQILCFAALDRLVARWKQRLEDEKHAHAKANLKQ
ncbi:DUF4760 domain-containing protein [Stenotrophomonas sp. S41]|uniref:DUF4760 domain-containing protein n=1 Tax=Stenotrophomonas sp. S41 TaxID=2767464 RepID=UPI00190D8414|nr:DUF4760 domain-containing protein [Stenotrophomonas sp. S41]MBK0010795.1 DUF4760 domain-containing protein [Stenotrophomonas sp. S41]